MVCQLLIKKKYHTKRPIPINKIKEIKKVLFEKLGIIPVYFFLVTLFGDGNYRGYSLYVEPIINNSELNDFNFVYLIRKDKNINLDDVELNYNDQFGSFRSKMEKVFSDIGFIFQRLNNKKSFLTSNINIYNIQLKIASVLLNIKRYVKWTCLCNIINHVIYNCVTKH